MPGRIGKQCRERWFNHLDPSIKRGEWTTEEDKILFEAQRVCGNRWCEIAKLLPGRTENAVKNRFNSSARKRWLKDNGLEDGSSDALMHDANRVCLSSEAGALQLEQSSNFFYSPLFTARTLFFPRC